MYKIEIVLMNQFLNKSTRFCATPGLQHDAQRQPDRVDGQADLQRHHQARAPQTRHCLCAQQETDQAHR